MAQQITLFKYTLPNFGNKKTDLPKNQLANAPTAKATNVAQAAAITP
jgi:hypothetical protein